MPGLKSMAGEVIQGFRPAHQNAKVLKHQSSGKREHSEVANLSAAGKSTQQSHPSLTVKAHKFSL